MFTRFAWVIKKTDDIRTEDNEKLQEKVNEALAVFNDYVKTQGAETSRNPEPSSDELAAEGESEGAKA